MAKKPKPPIATQTPKEQEDLFAEVEWNVARSLLNFNEVREQWQRTAHVLEKVAEIGVNQNTFAELIKSMICLEERMGLILEQATLALAGHRSRWKRIIDDMAKVAELAAQTTAESRALRARIELRPFQADDNVNHTASAGRGQQAIPRAKVGVGATDAGPSNAVPERIAKHPTSRSDGTVRKRRKPR